MKSKILFVSFMTLLFLLPFAVASIDLSYSSINEDYYFESASHSESILYTPSFCLLIDADEEDLGSEIDFRVTLTAVQGTSILGTSSVSGDLELSVEEEEYCFEAGETSFADFQDEGSLTFSIDYSDDADSSNNMESLDIFIFEALDLTIDEDPSLADLESKECVEISDCVDLYGPRTKGYVCSEEGECLVNGRFGITKTAKLTSVGSAAPENLGFFASLWDRFIFG